MFLYAQTNLLSIKDITSSGINNYIKIWKDSVKDAQKMEKDKRVLKKFFQCYIYRTLSLV